MLAYLLVCLVIGAQAITRGVAYIGESSNYQRNLISGVITLDDQGDSVLVTGTIYGLVGEHGFHVHQYGDSRDTASTTTFGLHFVPLCINDPAFNDTCADDQDHGYPPSLIRHPGDMGNITFINGQATVNKVIGQSKMNLQNSLRSVLGRTVMIHSLFDDGMQSYGNAGVPAAYGIIGLANPGAGVNDAAGPGTPRPRFAISVQTGIGADGASVSGFIYLGQAAIGDPISVQVSLTGLPAGSHAIGFFEYGEMDNTTAKYGAVLYGTIVVTSSGPTATVSMQTTLPSGPSALLALLGRMCAVFTTATPSTALTSVLSMGVVGVGAELPNQNGADGAGVPPVTVWFSLAAAIVLCMNIALL